MLEQSVRKEPVLTRNVDVGISPYFIRQDGVLRLLGIKNKKESG